MDETQSIPFHLLPLGFRFHPTDEELINYYLKSKINGKIKAADAAVVPEIDVCRFEPWDLPERSPIKSNDPEWFFFAPVDRKYANSGRSNRATEAGYWKATGKDRLIRSRVSREKPAVLVGMKKTLVFHRGRAPKGSRTNWIMHEYRTVEPEFENGGDQGSFVLCRLFKKSEETLSPTPAKSSPSSMSQREDGLEEEFATSSTRESPESHLQKELQPLPITFNKQPADIRLADEANYLVSHPIKLEERHCNSNMTLDAGEWETKNTGVEDPPLFDDLAQFLGPEYEHLFSDDLPQINSLTLISSDYGINSADDQTQAQYQTSEQDSVSALLDAMLSTPEEYSADVADCRGETEAVSDGQISMINDTDSCMSSYVDSEALRTQGGLGLETESTFYFQSMEIRNLPVRYSKFGEYSVGPANSIGDNINIRHRNRENMTSSFASSFNYPEQQGIAERRIRLQSSNQMKKISKQDNYINKMKLSKVIYFIYSLALNL
ncbi:NAC domain-containing protein 91-like [Asparagus officinalis]|uniref:NAC domain-containing protein 91-like n=1 Tax=Asparagus officinalis TaxID=4686 RepID=UPI00098E7A17|nr:NAC domain-containing protein 91-like [Asparagus officinalis]